MAPAEQVSTPTPSLVMFETWPREFFFGPVYRTSTVNMKQRSTTH